MEKDEKRAQEALQSLSNRRTVTMNAQQVMQGHGRSVCALMLSREDPRARAAHSRAYNLIIICEHDRGGSMDRGSDTPSLFEESDIRSA